MEQGYFAHFTDIHIGGPELAGRDNPISKGIKPGEALAGIPRHKIAEQYLITAIDEVETLVPKPAFVLVTGDLVALGSEGELRRYREIAQRSKVPLLATPSNHDLWGDSGSGWDRVMGPRRHRFEYAGVRFFLMDEYEPLPGGEPHQWRAKIRPELFDWLREGLESWPPFRPVILSFHAPILLLEEGRYADVWERSAGELLKMLSERNVLALIAGHWHRNSEWTLKAGGNPVRLIATGSLMGQQWTGIPPHYWFPTRPGYRLFCIRDGELYTFWRELWTQVQANLVWAGPVHTGGPRPQVRPIKVFSQLKLTAKGYGLEEKIAGMDWGLCASTPDKLGRARWRALWWRPMEKVFDALWSEWETEFNPLDADPGNYVLIVRARTNSAASAYDAVPVEVSREPSSVPAEAGPEMVFELSGIET